MSQRLNQLLSELARELQAKEGPEYNGDFPEGFEAGSHGAGVELQELLVREGAWADPVVMGYTNTLESDLKSLLVLWRQVANGQVQILKSPEEQKGFQDCAGQAHQALSEVLKRHGIL